MTASVAHSSLHFDGDRGDGAHKRRLIASGVPKERIVSLPAGKATEDLIDREVYLAAVNGVIQDSGGVFA